MYLKKLIQSTLLFALLATLVTTAFAKKEDDQTQEYRQHGTHVHGEGELLIVLEENKLEMSFRIPAMDLIGFEHAARTKRIYSKY